MKHLPRGTRCRERTHFKRTLHIIGNKNEDIKPFKPLGTEVADTSYGATGCDICPARLQSCSGPVFPQSVLIPLFWNRDVYFVSFCIDSIIFCF